MFQFHLVTLTVIMNDIYISVDCIMCPNCFHVFDNPLIVNCENNCVICKKCVNKLANIKKNEQVAESGVIIKVEVDEELCICVCGTYFEKTKPRTEFGLEKVINDYKCEG